MKELPYLEEIYDFQTDQLETLLADIEKLLDPNHRPTQLPKGYESFEKLERKAIKLKEHVELELEERRQVDDVISFFVSKAGVGSKQIDMLNDEQFYQPAGPSKPQAEVLPQPLPLNPQNLAMLPHKQQMSLLAPPSNVNFDTTEQQSTPGINHSQFDAQLSDVHSSVSRQLFDQRGPGSGVAVGANAMKNKKDLQAFMREKLAKTKISSEATSSIQPIAQTNKNFTGLPIKKRDDDARSSVVGSSVSGVSGMPRSSTADKQNNFYKPQLKNTKESANFVSGPSKPVLAARKASAVRQEKPVKQSSEIGQKADKKNLNNDKPKQPKPPKKEPEEESSAPLAKQQSNIYKPAIKKPSSRQSSKPPAPVKKEPSKQITLNDSKLLPESQASTKDRSDDATDEDVGQWSSQVPQTLSSVQNQLSSTFEQEDDEDLHLIAGSASKEEIESSYDDDPQRSTHQEFMKQDDQKDAGGDQDEEDYGGEDDEEEKAKDQEEGKAEDDEDGDFYSELGATAPQSKLQIRDIAKDLEQMEQRSSTTLEEEPLNPVKVSQSHSSHAIGQRSSIRGKVQLIVDEEAVQRNSQLTTPRVDQQQIKFDKVQYEKKEEQLEKALNAESDDSEDSPLEIYPGANKDEPVKFKEESATSAVSEIRPKQPSKTLELIKKITSQAAELNDEEVRQKKKEEQEQRIKEIRDMAEKEKKTRQEEGSKTQTAMGPGEKAESQQQKSDVKKKEDKVVKKPPVKKAAPKPQTIESDLVSGMQVQDYSHLYKSFYDIFVGQVLEPKTFDLQFVVRDTRNTYASFVSLMTMENNIKKKYQFEQAPMERSLQDYYAQALQIAMPNFFELTGKSLKLGGDQAPGGSDIMAQALAQAELKDRYLLLKNRDMSEILRDAALKAQSTQQQPAEQTESSLYYRVVKNRSEVYDIISRSFSRKKNWNELPHGLDLRNSWNLLWTWSKIKIDLSKLLVWQRCNHFSGAKNVSRKDFLKRNIEMAMRMSPKAAQVFNITPLTFILPKEYVNFLECFSELEDKEGKLNYWIMKPAAKSRGRGISLVNDLSQISYGEPIVVQRYIKNPLLINGYKFDMRIYVVVTSVNPLEAFLYKDGFGRFSTIPFSLDPTDKNNKYIHLTNVSIQKYNNTNNNEYLQSEDGAADMLQGGTKISIPTLKKRVQQETGVSWDEAIWPQIRDVIVKTLVACQNDMQFNPCAFELFGYDILVDSDLKCWLIEVNSSPSLARDTLLDDMVKSKLIDDIIDMLDPVDFDRKRLFEVLERRINEDFKGGGIQTGATSRKQMNRDLTYILNGRVPRNYGEMPRAMGNFERIAPSPSCEQYLKLIGGQKMFGSMMKLQPDQIPISEVGKVNKGKKGGAKKATAPEQKVQILDQDFGGDNLGNDE